ncbi:MAG: ribosome maturation factor RimM, partial [Nitrospirales bacterium]
MVTIGKILKPFGIRGQVRVESLSDVPDRFEDLKSVTLICANGDRIDTNVQSVRQIGEGYILGFSAFNTPETASGYRGALIQIPEQPDLPREPDTYYQFELIGLQVEDQEGQHRGTVEDILDFPHQQVLVIQHEGQEWLLPARKEMIESIDIADSRLRLA